MSDRQVTRVDITALTAFAAATLQAVNMSSQDAALAADAMVRTESRGILSHGIRHLPRYIHAIKAGGVNARARFEVVRETLATAMTDGHAGLGQVVATKALRLAITKARAVGSAVVTVRNSSHLGALGHYALLASEADMIAVVSTTTPRVMAAPEVPTAIVGSGPISLGVPSEGLCYVLDIAMSVVSGNRINMALESGDRLSPGWIIDSNGRSSVDPGDYRGGGALLPIAGHKGFGLALFCELVAGVLSGLDWDDAHFRTHQPGGVYFADLQPCDQWNLGHSFFLINTAAFTLPAEFRARAARFLAAMRATAKGRSLNAPRIPGERAARAEADARHFGVPVRTTTVLELIQLADELGIDGTIFHRSRVE